MQRMGPTGSAGELAWDPDTIKAGDVNMDENLYRYTCEAIRESAKHFVYGIATDKASPASGSVTNTVITFKTNVGIVCCPSVPWASKHGSNLYDRQRIGLGGLGRLKRWLNVFRKYGPW